MRLVLYNTVLRVVTPWMGERPRVSLRVVRPFYDVTKKMGNAEGGVGVWVQVGVF